MAEITMSDLKKVRESLKLPRWKVADRIGVSESTLENWEVGRVRPDPDDVWHMCVVYGDVRLWHLWMRSTYESYREMYPETKDMIYPMSVVEVRHQMDDVRSLQDRAERDAMSGEIDDPTLRSDYTTQLRELQEAVMGALNNIGKKGS